jgi:hypothetical protein
LNFNESETEIYIKIVSWYTDNPELWVTDKSVKEVYSQIESGQLPRIKKLSTWSILPDDFAYIILSCIFNDKFNENFFKSCLERQFLLLEAILENENFLQKDVKNALIQFNEEFQEFLVIKKISEFERKSIISFPAISMIVGGVCGFIFFLDLTMVIGILKQTIGEKNLIYQIWFGTLGGLVLIPLLTYFIEKIYILLRNRPIKRQCFENAKEYMTDKYDIDDIKCPKRSSIDSFQLYRLDR